jgi:hypothetical protein
VLDWIRATRRWRDVPLLIRRHPQLRRELALGVFWQRTHALLPLAVYGLRRTARHPLWAALAIPWALQHHNHPGGVRGRIRQLAELPGWAIVDLAELSTVARGAIQHRSPVL